MPCTKTDTVMAPSRMGTSGLHLLRARVPARTADRKKRAHAAESQPGRHQPLAPGRVGARHRRLDGYRTRHEEQQRRSWPGRPADHLAPVRGDHAAYERHQRQFDDPLHFHGKRHHRLGQVGVRQLADPWRPPAARRAGHRAGLRRCFFASGPHFAAAQRHAAHRTPPESHSRAPAASGHSRRSSGPGPGTPSKPSAFGIADPQPARPGSAVNVPIAQPIAAAATMPHASSAASFQSALRSSAPVGDAAGCTPSTRERIGGAVVGAPSPDRETQRIVVARLARAPVRWPARVRRAPAAAPSSNGRSQGELQAVVSGGRHERDGDHHRRQRQAQGRRPYGGCPAARAGAGRSRTARRSGRLR